MYAVEIPMPLNCYCWRSDHHVLQLTMWEYPWSINCWGSSSWLDGVAGNLPFPRWPKSRVGSSRVQRRITSTGWEAIPFKLCTNVTQFFEGQVRLARHTVDHATATVDGISGEVMPLRWWISWPRPSDSSTGVSSVFFRTLVMPKSRWTFRMVLGWSGEKSGASEQSGEHCLLW